MLCVCVCVGLDVLDDLDKICEVQTGDVSEFVCFFQVSLVCPFRPRTFSVILIPPNALIGMIEVTEFCMECFGEIVNGGSGCGHGLFLPVFFNEFPESREVRVLVEWVKLRASHFSGQIWPDSIQHIEMCLT